MEVQSTESDASLRMLAWFHANQKKLVIGGVAVVIIALIWGIVGWKKTTAESDANAQLLKVPLFTPVAGHLAPPDASQFLSVATEYPDTDAGQYAELLAAETLFLNGKYPEAHHEFTKFIENHSDSPLVPQAKVGVAASLEGEGKASDAALKYQELIAIYSTDASITEPARLTLARLEESLNKPDQALTYYSELARNNNPNDPWAAEARERGALLLFKHPELRKETPAPGAAQSAPAGGMGSFPAATAPVPSAKKTK